MVVRICRWRDWRSEVMLGFGDLETGREKSGNMA